VKREEEQSAMAPVLEPKEARENYRACQAYTREHARSFYFASHVLPKEKRLSAYAVYAFCRYADNLVDTMSQTTDPAHALEKVKTLRGELRHVYTSSERMDRRFLALHDTVLRYRIPEEYFQDLLRGVEMDLTKKRYATFAELQEYCYCVASVVGLIMTKIFGLEDERGLAYAADLGTAMQLTNILRDIREDYSLGRIYLPADELKEFGYSEEELAHGVINENFRAFMRFQTDRARHYYVAGARGIPLLTNDGSRSCVSLMRGTYAGILDRIERNGYDVFSRRAYVPFAGKLLIALRAALPAVGGIEGDRTPRGPARTVTSGI
jgi:15-cis-phytoene synthase